MKHVMNARRALKTKSVFNLLGPLTNPLRASVQLVGVYDASRTEMMARALGAVGTERAFVVTGSDGMDEITLSGPTRSLFRMPKGVRDPPRDPGRVRLGVDAPSRRFAAETQRPTPGLHYRPSRRGQSPPGCGARQHCRGVCGGDQGAELYPGVAMAAEVIDSGRALETLQRLVDFTQRNKRPLSHRIIGSLRCRICVDPQQHYIFRKLASNCLPGCVRIDSG